MLHRGAARRLTSTPRRLDTMRILRFANIALDIEHIRITFRIAARHCPFRSKVRAFVYSPITTRRIRQIGLRSISWKKISFSSKALCTRELVVCIFRERSLIFCGQIFFFFFFLRVRLFPSSRSVNDANASTSAEAAHSINIH